MYISEDITDLNYSKLEGEIDVLADKSSKAERRAVDLERDVTRMKMAEYMENMIGEVFVGNISGMIESGMFIELDNTIEGMIKFETIRSDFLIFDPKRMVVYSRGSKKEYHLGDPLKVICLAASKETGKIEDIKDKVNFCRKICITDVNRCKLELDNIYEMLNDL